MENRTRRRWIKMDELILVNGYRDYKSLYPKKQASFHEHVKEKLSFQFSAAQLREKLKKLKRKYRKIHQGGFKGGLDSHQDKLLDLFIQIWGASGEEQRRGRLWSQKDELVLIDGFREYQSLDPTKKKQTSFHESIKRKLSFQCSEKQLMDKVKKLKKKYRTVKGEWLRVSARVWGNKRIRGNEVGLI